LEFQRGWKKHWGEKRKNRVQTKQLGVYKNRSHMCAPSWN
jgi:hypothetical protein